MARLTRAAILGAACLPLVVAMAPAAHADEPLVREHYSGSDSGRFRDCGFKIEYESTFSGLFQVRAVEGSDQAFLGFDNYQYETVFTNPATGAWFVQRGNGLFRETSATHIEGNVYEFTARESGQTFVVEDSSGKIVLRDRGSIEFRMVFDTLGDGQIGGVLIEDEVVGIHGPHPGFFVDFCAVATELIG